MPEQLAMFPPRRPPDVCHRRHRGSAESCDAFRRVSARLPHQRLAVLEFVRGRGNEGATVHEIAAHFGGTPNQYSGRISELKASGAIEKTDQRRAGAAVVVATT